MTINRFLSNHYSFIAALLVVTLVFAAACSNPATATPDKGSDEIAPLTEQMLKNAAYEGIYEETVQLTDGKYEGEPFVEGGASRPTVTFADAFAFGDLNGDGVDDAVVVLVESSGGSGSFRYLAAVLNRNGNPENVATHFLGDRGQVELIAMDAGEITVNMVTHGPDDPMCCPSQKVVETYVLEGDELVQTWREVEGADEAVALTEEALRNGTYRIEDLGEIQLSDGAYENRYGDGATMVDKVGLESVALGDLNGDGVYDGATVLWWDSGGSGTFRFLVAVISEDGVPRQAAIQSLGDRVKIESLTVSDGQIVLEAVTHGPNDPMCCPTQIVRNAYTLKEGGLVEMASEVIGTVEEAGQAVVPPELLNKVWQWQEYVDMAGLNNITVDDPGKYTLEFLPDGNYQVVADCNRSGGRYTVDGSRLTLEPGPTTLAECEPGSLYDEYLSRLGDVVTYVLDEGRLVLNLKADAGNLIFVQVAATIEDIVDVEWQWSELVETAPAAQSIVPDPEHYTLVFRSDGTLHIKADCNVVGGSYTLAGDALSIKLGPSTMAFCGEQSLDQQYLALLGNVGGYVIENERLVLYLQDGAGKMTFYQGA